MTNAEVRENRIKVREKQIEELESLFTKVSPQIVSELEKGRHPPRFVLSYNWKEEN